MRPCRRATALTVALPTSMTAASMATAPVDDVNLVVNLPADIPSASLASMRVDEIQTLVTGAR